MYSDECELFFKETIPTNPDFNHSQLFRTLLGRRRRIGIQKEKKIETDLVTIFRIEYHGVEKFQLSRQRVLCTYHHYMCPTFGHAPVIYCTLLLALYKCIYTGGRSCMTQAESALTKSIAYILLMAAAGHIISYVLVIKNGLSLYTFHSRPQKFIKLLFVCFSYRYDRSSGASQRGRWASLWRDFSWSWWSRPISSLVPNRLFHSNLQVKPIVFHFFSSMNDSKNVTKDRLILFCISLYDYIK